MPIKISDLHLLEEFENAVTQMLIEARVDSLVLTTIRNRILDLQIEFTKLITQEPDDESPSIIINNYITSSARNAK